MHTSLQLEMPGDPAAAMARTRAAVASGLVPTLLQQLPAAMYCALGCAKDLQRLGPMVRVDNEGACSRAVQEMGNVLAGALTGEAARVG
jgi:hypothetical protein